MLNQFAPVLNQKQKVLDTDLKMKFPTPLTSSSSKMFRTLAT